MVKAYRCQCHLLPEEGAIDCVKTGTCESAVFELFYSVFQGVSSKQYNFCR